MPDWFPTTVAEVVAFAPIRITFLIIVALVARTIAHKVINRAVSHALRDQPTGRLRTAETIAGRATGLDGARRDQRLTALGSLARNIVSVVLVFVTAVMVLAELGFNINSIVAGTSIVAVTVAFGLQNVVKDFVSGVFILIEDQLGIGDYVDMKEASGVVEAIGLRVTRLRDDDGTAWYVRNGEMIRIGNYSQGGPGRPPEVDAETVPAR
ncbi:MAG: mechanosensitive ion channel family protein [Propionibacteriaceae bacterium]